MHHQLNLSLYGITIRIHSKQMDALNILESEFGYFQARPVQSPHFNLTLHHFKAPQGLIPELKALKISQNSLTYADGTVRWNDYFGKALTVYDYQKKEGVIYCDDLDLLHEISYLMILSLTGKSLDQNGLHKVHACGFKFRQRDVLVMLPSKGGKTTLFLNLAQRNDIELISDDTPLINSRGEVLSFPLRVGVDEIPDFLQAQAPFPIFKRQKFNDKFLIPLTKLPASISQGPSGTSILIIGIRSSSTRSYFYKAGFLVSMKALIEHMVIGIGLPMVLEYFIQHTVCDWIRLTKIAFSRLSAAIKLWKKSQTYIFVMSNNPKKNADYIIEELKSL
jgi:hypothetical protein